MNRVTPSRSEILDVIVNAIRTIAPDAVRVDATTHLLGPSAVLDSVGFVTLLIAIEQSLASAVDLSSSLMEQDATAEADNPFRTVASLTDHIERLLST
jgi:acyl carrier protein